MTTANTLMALLGVGMALIGAYFSADHKCKNPCNHPRRRKSDREQS